MRNFYLFFFQFIALTVFAQPAQQPKEYIVGGIEVEGNTYYTTESIIGRSGLQVGNTVQIPGDDFSSSINILWETGLFADIEIQKVKTEGKYIFLNIVVTERPRLAGLVFNGVRKSQADDLVDQIQLKEGNPLTDFAKGRINRIIESYYVDKGFLYHSVELVEDTVENKPNYVQLQINIDKGRKVKIEQIKFNGLTDVPTRKLRRLMKDTKMKTTISLNPKSIHNNIMEEDSSYMHFLGNMSIGQLADIFGEDFAFRLFNPSKFIQSNLDNDIKVLEEYFKNKGYRDIEVKLDSMVKGESGDVKLFIGIEEGQRYYFRNIYWKGNTKYPDAVLDKILSINKGDVYSPERLNKKLFFDMNGGDVSSLYMDDGYLFFQLVPEESKVVGDSIDLVLNVIEGPQATINNIFIEGNSKTNENVIRRELRTYPGYKFSRSDLIRSQREIAALNFFDPEQIGIEPIPNQEDGTVDIKYTVVEKPSDQIELSAGYGGFIGGLYGQAGIVLNNLSFKDFFKKGAWKPVPSGNGESLALRIQSNGRFSQQYSASVSLPWIGGKRPDALQISTNYTFFNTTGLPKEDDNSAYIISRGGTVGYSKRLKRPDDYFNLTSAITFKNYFLKNFNGFIISDGYANNLALEETLTRNSLLGNPIFPTGGSQVTLAASFTPPYSLLNPSIVEREGNAKYKFIEYHKWKFKADWYTRLAGSTDQGKRQLVLRTTAKFGFLGAYNPQLGVSTFERFRVGGDGLSGGFQLNGFDIIALRGTENAFTPVGGKAGNFNAPLYNKFSAELRYPFSLNPSSVIFALAFIEGGNSYADFANYNPANLRRSAGVGLRVFLPMFGLLGFDYGIGFDQPGLEGADLGTLLSNGIFQFKLGIEPE